ncbi:MAG: hypothetical protein ABWZ65_09275 [Pseudomonas mandelii]
MDMLDALLVLVSTDEAGSLLGAAQLQLAASTVTLALQQLEISAGGMLITTTFFSYTALCFECRRQYQRYAALPKRLTVVCDHLYTSKLAPAFGTW